MKNKNNIPIGSYKNATGEIKFNMTNDYMFRVVNQKSPNVAKFISCAVLHLDPATVKSAEIQNPIELGNHIEDKDFVLDIIVLLDNSTIINLEMQVINEHNWRERSLSYLCRSFDQLYQGEDYTMAKPAIHAGFLNFQPFPDYPEFHASYKLKNEKNGMVYSDKFHLNVIDLTHINLSTDADKEFQLDVWAKFFTAQTWEEVIMLAENNPYIDEAAQTLYEANADRITEDQCRARRDYYKQQNTRDLMWREVNEKYTKATAENTELKVHNAELKVHNAELKVRMSELETRMAELEAQLAQQSQNK